eukprot:2796192-Amphidinium_carterae.2
MSATDWAALCAKQKDLGTWSGSTELAAAAYLGKKRIVVLTHDIFYTFQHPEASPGEYTPVLLHDRHYELLVPIAHRRTAKGETRTMSLQDLHKLILAAGLKHQEVTVSPPIAPLASLSGGQCCAVEHVSMAPLTPLSGEPLCAVGPRRRINARSWRTHPSSMPQPSSSSQSVSSALVGRTLLAMRGSTVGPPVHISS